MTAKTIKARFTELGHDIPLDAITKRIDDLTGRFRVPQQEAESSVVAYFLRETGVERSEYYEGAGGNQTVSIADIPQEDGKWINLRAKCSQIWDTVHESMAQVGLIGDETGRVKYTIWKNADLPPLEEGKSYSFENIVTNEWNDRISVTFNKTSVITEIEEDIAVGYLESEYIGAVVAIKASSGLIKRCPECKRALKNGTCSEHGAVDGVYDLRILAVLDDGTSTQDIMLNKELTESVWGSTMDTAMSMATDALDAGVVAEDIGSKLLGRYYKVVGGQADTMLIAKTCEAI